MVSGFEQIERGMDKDQVVSIIGDPTETRHLSFGNELLTTWVYHNNGKVSYVWFGEDERVKITSVD